MTIDFLGFNDKIVNENTTFFKKHQNENASGCMSFLKLTLQRFWCTELILLIRK